MISVDALRTGVTAYLVFCVYATGCFSVCLFYISLLMFSCVFSECYCRILHILLPQGVINDDFASSIKSS